jgi:hypothetical protein
MKPIAEDFLDILRCIFIIAASVCGLWYLVDAWAAL